MLTKKQLLNERERLLLAVGNLEDLLKSLHGWEPSQPSQPKPPRIQGPGRLVSRASSGGISYSTEVLSFLDAQSDDAEFTMADFKSYLHDKFGESAVNETSIAVPFRKQIDKTIRIHKQGQGSSPNTYKKIDHLSDI